MRRYALRPWNFTLNQPVYLYWIGNPYKNEYNRWVIKALFETNDEKLEERVFPWASLMALRIGRMYIDGIMQNTQSRGNFSSINIPKNIEYNICKGFDMPKSLYPFADAPFYGNLALCHFTIGNMNFYIPTVEVIRGILTRSTFLLNRILHPPGWDDLIEYSNVNGKNLEISLFKEFPYYWIQQENFLLYFIWLVSYPKAIEEWHNVYKNLVFRGGSFIAKPPSGFDWKWNFRSLSFREHCLILEITHISGISLPFDEIVYSSPHLFSIEHTNQIKGVSFQKDASVIIQEESGAASNRWMNSYYPKMEQTLFLFSKKPVLKKNIVKSRQLIKQSKRKIREQNTLYQKYTFSLVGTTQEWEQNGYSNPIDFVPLPKIKQDKYPYFKAFLDAIDILSQFPRVGSVSLNILQLLNRRNKPTNCAVVRIVIDGGMAKYIIEINRMGSQNASTLILFPLVQLNDDALALSIDNL